MQEVSHEADALSSDTVLARIQKSIARAVVGQTETVERLLVALLTGGHILLEGMPGVAKTLLVLSVAKSVRLDFQRVQFTVDLLPADVLGCEVYDEHQRSFRSNVGPVFTNLLLADEINRAAPKVQSALLEAMQERRVTIGRETLALPTPFVVIATQNPVETSGTFELPEAQLDRFMLCHRVQYPSRVEEQEIVRRTLGLGLRTDGEGVMPASMFDTLDESEPTADRESLGEMMAAVKRVHVSDVLIRHGVELMQLSRECPDLVVGCSPRASLALIEGARARAYLHGREYAIPDDLFSLLTDVMQHRVRPTYAALAAGRTAATILRELADRFVSQHQF